jgi:hypothetical protein
MIMPQLPNRRKPVPLPTCPMCRASLEPVDGGWICSSCLVRWHGDTFEPLEDDCPDLPSYFDFGFGM